MIIRECILSGQIKEVIKIDETTSHAFAIISDETGYCILDQINKVNCYQYSN